MHAAETISKREYETKSTKKSKHAPGTSSESISKQAEWITEVSIRSWMLAQKGNLADKAIFAVVAMVVRVDDCLSLNTLDTYYVNYNLGHFSCGLMHANTAINGCGRGCCAHSGRGGEDKIIWPMMCLIF